MSSNGYIARVNWPCAVVLGLVVGGHAVVGEFGDAEAPWLDGSQTRVCDTGPQVTPSS